MYTHQRREVLDELILSEGCGLVALVETFLDQDAPNFLRGFVPGKMITESTIIPVDTMPNCRVPADDTVKDPDVNVGN